MRRIQRSLLIAMDVLSGPAPSGASSQLMSMNAPLTSERGRDRQVEAESAALDDDVAGQAAERQHPSHTRGADRRHQQPDDDEDGPHRRHLSSRPRKK